MKKTLVLTEGALDRCQVGVRIDLDMKYKLLHKHGASCESIAEIIRGVIAADVKGVRLTGEERRKIAAEKRENYEKRMSRRAEKRDMQREFLMKDYSEFIETEAHAEDGKAVDEKK